MSNIIIINFFWIIRLGLMRAGADALRSIGSMGLSTSSATPQKDKRFKYNVHRCYLRFVSVYLEMHSSSSSLIKKNSVVINK